MSTNSSYDQLRAAQDTLLAIAATKVEANTAVKDLHEIKLAAYDGLIASGFDKDMLDILFGAKMPTGNAEA